MYQISEDIDKKYIFSNLDFARNLLQYPPNTFSSIEIKVLSGANTKDLRKEVQKILGEAIEIKDRTQLNTAPLQNAKYGAFGHLSYFYTGTYHRTVQCSRCFGDDDFRKKTPDDYS